MMKTIFVGILAVLGLVSATAFAQRSCGNSLIYNELRKNNPSEYQRLTDRHLHELALAQGNPGTAAKSTADQSPIPVVFHFVLTQSQFIALGREDGIRRRVVTQLGVLNRDYNRGNSDSSLIPSAFKSLYDNANIQFGLAHQYSDYTFNVGIEVKILTTSPFYNVYDGCRAAKENGPHGLESWDPSRFLNIWVINAPGGVLGVTVAPRNKGETWANRTLDESDFGVVLNFGAFGVREDASQYFIDFADGGRTATHEVGHFFGLRHIWGDDAEVNPAGYCPNQMVNGVQVGFDDGITDTPPQSRSTVCANGVCPAFPRYDACSPSGAGLMFMNYMDYVDDVAMQMFTTGQAAAMRAQIAPGGAMHGLTQSPWLISVGVPKIEKADFHLYPNPATDKIRISFDGTVPAVRIHLINAAGQRVYSSSADGNRAYEIQTSDLPGGLYIVQCQFADEILSRKIVLQ